MPIKLEDLSKGSGNSYLHVAVIFINQWDMCQNVN